MSAKVVRVIETDFELRGKGTEASPLRRVTQYWSERGDLLAEVDPLRDIWTLSPEEAEQIEKHLQAIVRTTPVGGDLYENAVQALTILAGRKRGTR